MLSIKNKTNNILILLILLLSACQQSKQAAQVPTPLSIAVLQQRTYITQLSFEKSLEGTDNYQSDLWSFTSDSLEVFTLVQTPKTAMPQEGFPILIFGHGFHPEPKKYGVSTSIGKNWRPGDYYRGVPAAYAKKGYLTITPDYRGHNQSEGFEYTQTSYLASTYYAIDVLHLISALQTIKGGNPKEVYFVGHSMGGDVGLKMLLATDKIKAASLWAPVAASTWEQALYYGKYYDEDGGKTDAQKMKDYLAKLNKVLEEKVSGYDIDAGDAMNYIQQLTTPIVIHHARKENSVPYIWSESLAAKLFKHQKTFELYAYDSENHLLKGDNRAKAVERDILFFKKQ